ncbi:MULTISPECIES: hypothetical protein [unclassified Janthinobacterium]|uniref:hypothetical protein n=1 Tax=unclassified Janthinobacterium TaxID=2610881 RepID=UPI00034BC67F|nr:MULTISPECIES: hypothetical protein [unclassified Janthinobacterium]MEC5161087.1 hypothetical protein [Janthinobacterium sp. CG_S6]
MYTIAPLAGVPAAAALLLTIFLNPLVAVASEPAPPAARVAGAAAANFIGGPPPRTAPPPSTQAPDTDMVFITASSALSDAVAASCDRARLARYLCHTLVGARAALPAVHAVLEAPNILAVGVVGVGNASPVQVHGGALDTPYFQRLPAGALEHKVVFFTTRVDAAMPAAVMAAGARTFIRAGLPTPSAKSQAVFSCFWERVLLDTQAMAAALSVCASAEGVEGHFALSGDPGRFIDSLVGDRDDFHPGDAADVVSLSPLARSFVEYLQAAPGQGPVRNLDVPAHHNPVAVSHFMAVPRGYPIEAANVDVRIRMSGEVAGNDFILNNLTLPPYGSDRRFHSVIALVDLLREVPVAGKTYTLKLDVQSYPTRDFSADSYSGVPDNYRNMLPHAVSRRRLDLVFTDDTMVDYSSLVLKQFDVDTWMRQLIGDQDNFHAGDAADAAPKSAHVADLIAYFAGEAGAPAVDMDVVAPRNTVGLTHEITWLQGAPLITSATLKARVRVTGAAAGAQFILYNESALPTVAEPYSSNVIALGDLLGAPPQPGQTYNLSVNLAKVPLRARLAAAYLGRPDGVRDLLPMLRAQNRLDLLFGDGTALDYSELTLTYTVARAPAGDLNGDMAVNRWDLGIIMASLNTDAYGAEDPRDLDHDGRITIADARELVGRCDHAWCAYAEQDLP